MSEQEEKRDEVQRSPLAPRRPKAPIISGLSERGARSSRSAGLTVPKLQQADIRDASLHDPRPAVLAQLDLHKRTILKSDQLRQQDAEPGGAANEVTVSSTSEPPPNIGQMLPLPEALRAAAQTYPSPFAFEPVEHLQSDDHAESDEPVRPRPSTEFALGFVTGNSSPSSSLSPRPRPEAQHAIGTRRQAVNGQLRRRLTVGGTALLAGSLLVTLFALYLADQKLSRAEDKAKRAELGQEQARRSLNDHLVNEAQRLALAAERSRFEQDLHSKENKADRLADQLKIAALTAQNEGLQAELEVARRKRREAERARVPAAENVVTNSGEASPAVD